MAKIAQVSTKYIIQASINIDGVVDRPDVIGAIFGQTEGLLGSELELRELQRSGKIGRIEVNLTTKSGKTTGDIIIPSSLDKAETAIVAAALEIIERIGPCTALIKILKLEDVRVAKRGQVVTRAKELLHNLIDGVMPDSMELTEEVATSVRVMEIVEYGKDKLPAGPAIDESEDIIVVEGRADVLTLLKHGFKNAVAMNGSNVPQGIIDLCKEKNVTVFVDGDRGGELNVQALLQVTEIDFITRAPDGKEVEELTKKEIHKALRSTLTAEQWKLDHLNSKGTSKRPESRKDDRRPARDDRRSTRDDRAPRDDRKPRGATLTAEQKKLFSEHLEELIGTRGAYVLDDALQVLGKVPTSELPATVKALRGAFAVIFDGNIDQEIVSVAEDNRVKFLVGMDKKVKTARGVQLLTNEDLQ